MILRNRVRISELIKIEGFSRNSPKEITKTHCYYFWDNGIRIALVNNFNLLNMRDDQGQLWENFLYTERLKTQEYLKIYSNNFFWRTYDKKERDMIEERDGNLFGYDFKWNEKKKSKEPALWKETYKNAHYNIIHRENYIDFLTGNIP